MNKTKNIRRINNKINLFESGGNINGIISGISGIGNIVSMGDQNASLYNTEGTKTNIDKLNSFQSTATNNDSIMNQWGNYTPLQTVASGDFLGEDQTGNMALSGLSSGASIGGAIGSFVGPLGTAIGAGIGGIVGGIGGWIGGGASRNKAEKAAEQQAIDFNNQIKAANQHVVNSMFNNVNNISSQSKLNNLANFSAFGGRIKTLGNGGNLYTTIPNSGQHGGIFSNGVTIIGNGGTHEENPLQGIPMGIDPQGIPNLVEEGELKYNNYIFSNRLKVPKDFKTKYKLSGTTFAEVAKEAQKESSERPNDPISKTGLEDIMSKLQYSQEDVKLKDMGNKKKQINMFDKGGNLYLDFMQDPYTKEMYNNPLASSWNYEDDLKEALIGTETKQSPIKSFFSDSSNLRYIPTLGAGIASITDALGVTNKPDYTNAELIENSANGLQDVSSNPIGNYLAYNPLDRNYYTNKLNAQSGATRRTIVNQSGGNRATATAGLLAADYNAQSQMGDLFRNAEEYNLNQRMQVEQFNRGTNQFNSQQKLQADMANMNNDRTRMQAIMQGALMREQIDGSADNNKTINLTNLLDSIGDIGREGFARNMIKSNPGNYYYTDSTGNVQYKNKKSSGGYLTIKKRK